MLQALLRGAMATWSNYPRSRRVPGRYGCEVAFCSDGAAAGGYRFLIEQQLSRALADAGGAARCARRVRRGGRDHGGSRAGVAGETPASSRRAPDAPPGAAAPDLRHLVVVNAWNEGGEQAVVEPSVQHGDQILRAHARAVADVEARVVAELGAEERHLT